MYLVLSVIHRNFQAPVAISNRSKVHFLPEVGLAYILDRACSCRVYAPGRSSEHRLVRNRILHDWELVPHQGGVLFTLPLDAL